MPSTRSLRLTPVLLAVLAALNVAGTSPAFAGDEIPVRSEALVPDGSGPGPSFPLETVRFGGDYDFPPYEFIDKAGRPAGFHVDLMRAIGGLMGFRVEFRLGPWNEVKTDMDAGRLDVVALMRFPERESGYLFATAHEMLYHQIFVRRNDKVVQSVDDLAGHAVIVQYGAYPSEYLQARVPGARVVLVKSEAEALKLLASGKHDCAIVTAVGGQQAMERQGLTNLTTSGAPLWAADYSFAVRRGGERLRDRLDDAIAYLKATGQYEALRTRWLSRSDATIRTLSFVVKVGAVALAILILLGIAALMWTWSLKRNVAARTRDLEREMAERLRLEEELRQAQKMEAIGQLAGGIAHDFNNLLTGILGFASLLKDDARPGSRTHEAAATIEKTAERAAELTRQLLGFARKGKYRVVPVDVHRILAEIVRLLERTIDKGIRISTRCDARRAVVSGDPSQVQQVFLNLALNARDAMPGGGDLVFSTRLVDASGAPCSGDGFAPVFLEVAVRDTGCGIPDDVREHIFEPFFTTRKESGGTGMGLATAYGIVESHGGNLRVETQPGQGSTFFVSLPLSDGDMTPEPAVTPTEVPKGAGRVLLVDDEPVVREVGVALLRKLGYEVFEAGGGEEALRWYRENPGRADVVLMDMVMPGMTGPACFRALREVDPNVRVILTTGFGQSQKVHDAMKEGIAGFVAKPYQLGLLAETISRVIAGQDCSQG